MKPENTDLQKQLAAILAEIETSGTTPEEIAEDIIRGVSEDTARKLLTLLRPKKTSAFTNWRKTNEAKIIPKQRGGGRAKNLISKQKSTSSTLV